MTPDTWHVTHDIWLTVGSDHSLKISSPQLLRGDSGRKSRIQDKKHLSTDADSSTNTTVGWTKNTQKKERKKKIKNGKNNKTQKLKNI